MILEGRTLAAQIREPLHQRADAVCQKLGRPIKLCAIGNGDVTAYFNCRRIMIRIYCVHRCTLTCNNKVFRCTNSMTISISICVVGAKIGIYCDATLNGDITTLICFKRRTISVFALDVKSAPLIACDNEVYLILG